MTRRLKVYAAEIDGLNDWIVAAPNRPAALDAFGVRQDLFAQGLAREETDPERIEQAVGSPGRPLRRPKGSTKAFAPAGAGTDWSAAAPKAGGRKRKTPDRKPLERAQARLDALRARHDEALDDLAAEQARLTARKAEEDAAFDEALAQAEAEMREAKAAYGRAEGT